jgi:hypothetical protein
MGMLQTPVDIDHSWTISSQEKRPAEGSVERLMIGFATLPI